jgi:hypothetical protein
MDPPSSGLWSNLRQQNIKDHKIVITFSPPPRCFLGSANFCSPSWGIYRNPLICRRQAVQASIVGRQPLPENFYLTKICVQQIDKRVSLSTLSVYLMYLRNATLLVPAVIIKLMRRREGGVQEREGLENKDEGMHLRGRVWRDLI